MSFKSLRIEGWRQFGRIEIELHPRLTVLTGANGAGKSSLLRVFSRHFGFDRPFLATPQRTSDGGYTYLTGLFTGALDKLWKGVFSSGRKNELEVGVLTYSNGAEARLQVPRSSEVQYNLQFSGEQAIAGIHIDSHQPISYFQQVGQIPTNIINAATAYASYNGELMNKYTGGYTPYSPAYRMKEAMIAMALFGEGNSRVQGNREILTAFTGFTDVLRSILPETLGFIEISVRPPEVVLVTKSGEFLIDASSGGVMTLIDLAWRLHMFSLSHDNFVVTIDEPENHLHPTMQRTLMRRLLKAFPRAQFIIATHSPFMVSSVKDSTVYVLRHITNGKNDLEEMVMPSHTSRVFSESLDTINKAGNASAILREVLGVSATIPEWVEEGLNEVVMRYKNRAITPELLKELRLELKQLGYDELYPDALAAVTEAQ